MGNTRDNEHWRTEGYRQRVTEEQWRDILLSGEDRMVFRGRCRQLIADPLGYGVVEIFKEAL